MADRRVVGSGVLTATMILAGCSGGSPKAPRASPTTVAPVTTSTTAPAPSTTRPATAVHLTGFGASTTEWDRAHTADPSKPSAFGPIVTSAGQRADEYDEVSYTAGRVTGYSLHMPDKQSLPAAKAFIAGQLPPDAKLVSTYHSAFSDGGACLFLNYRSASLAAVLGAPPIGDTAGDVGVELYTVTSSLDDTLDGSNVNSGTLSDAAELAADGC